jgi:glutamyl-tRNA synthetase
VGGGGHPPRPTTPRQIVLARMLGLGRPTHAHVPLVLGPDGERLAKRHGAVTLADQRSAGRTPAEVLGWFGSSLGLCEPGQPVTPADLLASFDPAAVSRHPWTLPPTLL